MTDLEEKIENLDNAFWKLIEILSAKGLITGKQYNALLAEVD